MKPLFFIISIFFLLFTACKKSEGDTTRVVLYNASYSTSGLSAAWNGTGINASPLSQGQSSGQAGDLYAFLPAGTNNITVASGTTTIFDKNAYTAAGNAYTLLVYDTSAKSASLNTLLLTDDLTLPDTTAAKCRFINCAPDTMTLIPVMLNKADTFAFPNGSFIGRTPAATSIQGFATIKKGRYRFLLVQNVTGIIQYSAADSVTLTPQSIYSFIYSGLKTGSGPTGIKLSMLTHTK